MSGALNNNNNVGKPETTEVHFLNIISERDTDALEWLLFLQIVAKRNQLRLEKT